MLLHCCAEGKLPFPLKTESSELFFLHDQQLREGFDDLVKKFSLFLSFNPLSHYPCGRLGCPRRWQEDEAWKASNGNPVELINGRARERLCREEEERRDGEIRRREVKHVRAQTRGKKGNLCLMSSVCVSDWDRVLSAHLWHWCHAVKLSTSDTVKWN